MPSGTPSGEGVYLTVYPYSRPNTDTVNPVVTVKEHLILHYQQTVFVGAFLFIQARKIGCEVVELNNLTGCEGPARGPARWQRKSPRDKVLDY